MPANPAALPLIFAAALWNGPAPAAHAQAHATHRAKKHAPHVKRKSPTKPPVKPDALAASPAERLQFSSPAFLRIYGLRPGMTRAEVSRLYRPDGGLSGQTMQTFIYQENPRLDATFGIMGMTYGIPGDVLKIDVGFAPAASTTTANGSLESWEKDVVVSVSEPYFEPMGMN